MRVSGISPERSFPAMHESEVRDLAWKHCGILRDAAGLELALKRLAETKIEVRESVTRAEYEVRNMHVVAGLIASAALARRESRGGHYRTDFPQRSPDYQKHSVQRMSRETAFA